MHIADGRSVARSLIHALPFAYVAAIAQQIESQTVMPVARRPTPRRRCVWVPRDNVGGAAKRLVSVLGVEVSQDVVRYVKLMAYERKR